MNILKQNLFFLMFLFSIGRCLSTEGNEDPYCLQSGQEILNATGTESNIRYDVPYNLSSAEPLLLEEYEHNQLLFLSAWIEEALENPLN